MQVKETENTLFKSGIGMGVQKAIITEGKRNSQIITGNQKHKDLTLSVQQSVKQANKDKSQIMVDLMPFQGNSGRASTKMHTGRNHFENFSQKMDAMTGEQESLRVSRLSKGSMEGLRKGSVQHTSTKTAVLEQKQVNVPKMTKKAKTGKIENDEDDYDQDEFDPLGASEQKPSIQA